MRHLALVVAATLALSGCDLFGPSGPGVLDATLTAERELGAVVLEVTGPSVTGFVGQGSTRAYGALVSTAEVGRHRLVLVGEDGGPMRFGIEVDDRSADPPVVTVVTAADVNNRPTVATGVTVRVDG